MLLRAPNRQGVFVEWEAGNYVSRAEAAYHVLVGSSAERRVSFAVMAAWHTHEGVGEGVQKVCSSLGGGVEAAED